MPFRSESPPAWLDGVLYPDERAPAQLETLSMRVDFLARLCAAWDFGILPTAATVAEIRRPHWREAVEACQLLTSPAYHLLRLARIAGRALLGATTRVYSGRSESGISLN